MLEPDRYSKTLTQPCKRVSVLQNNRQQVRSTGRQATTSCHCFNDTEGGGLCKSPPSSSSSWHVDFHDPPWQGGPSQNFCGGPFCHAKRVVVQAIHDGFFTLLILIISGGGPAIPPNPRSATLQPLLVSGPYVAGRSIAKFLRWLFLLRDKGRKTVCIQE